jgi:hypothetical protein
MQQQNRFAFPGHGEMDLSFRSIGKAAKDWNRHKNKPPLGFVLAIIFYAFLNIRHFDETCSGENREPGSRKNNHFRTPAYAGATALMTFNE